MRKLNLHIGCYKTGTTYVQGTFFENRNNLIEMGYHYPGGQVNHHFSFFATKAGYEDWPRQFQSVEINKLKPAIKNYFLNLEQDIQSRQGSHIISTEYLFLDNKKFIECYFSYLNRFYDEINVFLFLRNPIDYYRSIQQQMIKARSFIANPATWVLPFKNVLQAWSQYADVKVIEYQKEKDSCESLCEEIGIDYSKLTKPDKQSNISLSIEQMLLLEKIQHQLYQQYENRFKNHLGEIQNINTPFTTNPQLRDWVKPVIYNNHSEDLVWLREEYGIDFLQDYPPPEELSDLPNLEIGKVTVRDIYKVPAGESVEKYEALVIDTLLKKLVQSN